MSESEDEAERPVLQGDTGPTQRPPFWASLDGNEKWTVVWSVATIAGFISIIYLLPMRQWWLCLPDMVGGFIIGSPVGWCLLAAPFVITGMLVDVGYQEWVWRRRLARMRKESRRKARLLVSRRTHRQMRRRHRHMRRQLRRQLGATQ